MAITATLLATMQRALWAESRRAFRRVQELVRDQTGPPVKMWSCLPVPESGRFKKALLL